MNFKQRLDRFLGQSDERLLPDDDSVVRESLEFANSFELGNYDLIISPGKFEGEFRYTPYFWNLSMNGCSDNIVWDQDLMLNVFDITAEDRAHFPELADIKRILISEDDYGFVYADLE